MRVIIYTDTDGDCSAQHCWLAAMGLSLGIVQGVSQPDRVFCTHTVGSHGKERRS